MWIQANGRLTDDPKLHAAMLAYRNDESVSDNVLVPYGGTCGEPGGVVVLDGDVLGVTARHAEGAENLSISAKRLSAGAATGAEAAHVVTLGAPRFEPAQSALSAWGSGKASSSSTGVACQPAARFSQ